VRQRADPWKDRDDEALIVLIASGDRVAFAELYDRRARIVYALARRVTGDAAHSEDVVQEVFLTVWRQAARFDSERGKPGTWLLMIAHRRAVDAVRRAERHAHACTGGIAEIADAIDVQREALRGSDDGRIHDALARLPRLQREVIELAYYRGLTQTQVAARLDVPVGTIKSRTHAALMRLRNLIEGHDIVAQA
jgi:RNA polymerase sigma-70 factor (ECF subfamily)